MDYIGTDFNSTGSVIPKSELTAARLKRGECPTCGRKCFKKKLFKMIPIDDDDNKVLQGRCLHCNPSHSSSSSHNKSNNNSGHNRNSSVRSHNSSSNKQLQRSTTYHPSNPRDVASSLPARAMSSPPHPQQSKAVKSDHTNHSVRSTNRNNTSVHSLTCNKSIHSFDEKSLRGSNDPSLRTTRSYRSIASHSTAGSLDSASTVTRSPQESMEKMTREEIQKAAEILMTAAHEHGLDGKLASLQDLVVNLAAESSGTIGTSDDEKLMLRAVSDERILDRGGALRCGRLIYAGSSRTLSSMSSIDETDHGNTNANTNTNTNTNPTTYIQYPQALRKSSTRTLGSLSTIDGANEEEIVSHSAHDHRETMKALESSFSMPEESIPASKKSHDDDDELYREETKCFDTEIDSIVQRLRDSMDSSSPFPSIKAMESLSEFLSLCLDEPSLHLYIEKGLASVLVSIMNKYPESPEIQRKVCEALTTLARSSSTRLRSIVEGDGVVEAILFSCLILHEDNPSVQEAALDTMLQLCQDCEENQIQFWKLDAIEPILRSMEHHSRAPRLQEIGAMVVSMFANNNPTAKNTIGEHGGVSVILAAMSMHGKDFRVVEACIQTLYTLISECPSNILVLLNSPGATNAILETMRCHKQILDVQEMGCAMLVKLTTLAEHTDLLLENGGSMETGKQENKKPNELLESVIETVLETIQNHSGIPIVQDFGFAILSNLTDSLETKMFVVDLGALDAMVLAMVLHKNSAGVQERICKLLLLLAVQENHQHILATNPIGLVKLAANKFPSCQEPASRLIRQLGLEEL